MNMFEIIAEHGNARVGLLKTPHGNFETPIFLPVATKAVIKTLTPEEAWNAGCRGIIVNALHLYRRGLDKIERAGGIHNFMGWKGFVVSDSGGFQQIKKFPCDVGNDGMAFSMPDGRVEISHYLLMIALLIHIPERGLLSQWIKQLNGQEGVRAGADLPYCREEHSRRSA